MQGWLIREIIRLLFFSKNNYDPCKKLQKLGSDLKGKKKLHYVFHVFYIFDKIILRSKEALKTMTFP